VQVRRLGFPDRYIEQGEQAELRAMYGLDANGIAEKIREFFAGVRGGVQALPVAPLDCIALRRRSETK